MALLVVAYPLLSPPDDAWIQAIRAQYDVERYRMIAPHFTLVFPTVAIEHSILLAHITEQTIGVSPLAFTLRCAMAVSDPLSATTHTFLVPDEGYSALVKLHDRLYTGVLTAALRLDLPFIPHITIGTAADLWTCKQLADLVNQQDIRIRGRIEWLSLLTYEHNRVETIGNIELAYTAGVRTE
jgi:2'-5' RNA ligase